MSQDLEEPNEKLKEIFNPDKVSYYKSRVIDNSSKEEFEKVLSDNGIWIVLNGKNGFTETTYEYIYGIVLKENPNNHTLHRHYIIYSSIDKNTDKFRDIGTDAIRIIRWINNKPHGKHIRVNRSKNWAANLSLKLFDFRINNKYTYR